MAVGRVDLSLYQGDDYSAVVRVTDAAGADADLTGATAQAQIRRAVADIDTTVDAEFSAVVESPNINLALTNAQTVALSGRYVWDLQITTAEGVIITLLKGNVFVTAEVTRAAVA